MFDQLECTQGPFHIIKHNTSRKQTQDLKDLLIFLVIINFVLQTLGNKIVLNFCNFDCAIIIFKACAHIKVPSNHYKMD